MVVERKMDGGVCLCPLVQSFPDPNGDIGLKTRAPLVGYILENL